MASSRYDDITIEQLRASGSFKWTTHPDAIGAFIAEMDFGVAPAVKDALTGAIDQGLLGYLPPQVSDAMSVACARWQRDRYGWDVPAARIRPIGDVLVAARAAVAYYDDRVRDKGAQNMVGQHGSLTPEERMVPLLRLGAFAQR